MAHVVRTEPSTLEELKGDVKDFARNFDPERPGGWPGTASKIAELGMSMGGDHFEHLIKKK